MEGSPFKENDLVWAKMLSWNHWPAIIREPHEQAPTKKFVDMQWVYFLGTHNYAWVKNTNIKPYHEYKSQYKKKNTEVAVKEMEEIIENMVADPNYKISCVEYVPPRSSSSKSVGNRSSTGSSTKEKKRASEPLKDKNSPVPKKKSKSSLSNKADKVMDQEKLQTSEVLVKNAYGSEKAVTLNRITLDTSEKFFGFLSGSIYSEGIIKNLIRTGHRLYVWSRNTSLCEELQNYADTRQAWFRICNNARQVVQNSEIIFSSLSDSNQAKQVMNELGVEDKQDNLLKGKGYVEMTSMGPETSAEFHQLITRKEGIYLEAMIQGNRQEATRGEIIVLAAGEQKLFIECQSCFKAMGQASFLLGKVGSATKIHLIFQMMRGVFLAAIVEGFAMADRCGIRLDIFNDIFQQTQMASVYLKCKSETIVHKKFSDPGEPLQQLQQDIALGLEMSNVFRQPLPLASNANEIVKHARRLGTDNLDSACIYNRTRY